MIMECKIGYNKREWINDELVPSTGNIIAFDGVFDLEGEPVRRTFLQISDCNSSIRFQCAEKDFVNQMTKFRDVIDDFINYLKHNSYGMQDRGNKTSKG